MNLLMLNPQASAAGRELSGAQWLLPDDADLAALRTSIEEAITARRALTTTVVLPGDRQAELTINAAALVTVLVVKIESGPA